MKFLDLAYSYRQIKTEYDSRLLEFLESGDYIMGSILDEFESKFSHFTDSKYCLGVGNGLDALRICLIAADVKPDSEVIVPAHTFIATWLAVSSIGAKPVPVDCTLTDYNIDYSLILDQVNDNTSAIVLTSIYGHPIDYAAASKIKDRVNIPIIEDAAQAHGASFHSIRTGSWADLTAWSFYPGKNLGAFGDGGAVTTSSQVLYERIKLLRNYGSTIKYTHEIQGLNSRLDPIQALALTLKLNYFSINHQSRVSMPDISMK